MSYANTLYSLILPLVYLLLLVGSLATFSSLHRRRQAAAAASLAPWFPPNLQRSVYLSLLELQANPTATATSTSPSQSLTTTDASSPKIPDSLLKAALLRRATEDIHRLIALRAQKPAATQLLQRGSVGDELMVRLQRAEAEMEAEIKDVVAEANALAPQQMWGNTIFQSASEAAHREMLARKLKEVEETRAGVKEEWKVRRKGIKDGFLKELDLGEEEAAQEGVAKLSSDEDAPVIVEGGGPGEESVGPATPGEGTLRRKKKGKK